MSWIWCILCNMCEKKCDDKEKHKCDDCMTLRVLCPDDYTPRGCVIEDIEVGGGG